MNLEPLISVIVPIYRIEKYVGECIESILKQTYTNLQIILVNDGSDDRCGDLCDLYAAKDQRIQVVHKSNGGLVSARKAGLEVATGQFVGYVDGDDYIKPHFYETLLEEIDDSDVVCAGFTRKLFDRLTEIRNLILPGIYEKENLKRIKKQLISSEPFYTPGITTYVWNKLFKRELLMKYQNCVSNAISIGEDAAVSYPLLMNCSKIVVSNNVDYVYRQREDSMLKNTQPFYNELKGIRILHNELIEKVNRAEEQINDYILSTCIMRSGGLTVDNDVLFPFTLDFKNKKIIVVNAGTFGQQFISRIKEYNYCTIVAWLDEDCWEYRRCCLNVDPIKAIDCDYDYVVIAQINHSIAKRIEDRLIELGYREDSIVTVNVPKQQRLDLLSQYLK